MFTSNDKINKIKVSNLNEQLLTLKQQKQQLEQSTVNYQMNERIIFMTNYQLVQAKNYDEGDEEIIKPEKNTQEPDNTSILDETQSKKSLEKRYSFLNSITKHNHKYLTYSSSSASKTFDKSFRNIFKYIRSYNNGNNNENNLK